MRLRLPFAAGTIASVILATVIAVGGFLPTHTSASNRQIVHPANLVPTKLHGKHASKLALKYARIASSPGAGAETADLSRLAESVRDQQQNGSCASYGTSESAYSQLLIDGFSPSDPLGFAPMFQYTQLVQSPAEGTSFEGNFGIEEQNGLVPVSQYSYGQQAALTDWSDQPQAIDFQNASRWHLTGFNMLFYSGGQSQGDGTQADQIVRGSLDSGQPVMLGISVFDPFEFQSHGLIPAGGAIFYGYHAIVAYGYDAKGVWILNSWGPGWGMSYDSFPGYGHVSWAFIEQDVFAAYVDTGATGPGPNPYPSPTPQPTDTPTPSPTVTPGPSPTPTPKPHPRHPHGWPKRPGRLIFR